MNLEIETKFTELDKNLKENFYNFFPKEEGDKIIYHNTGLAALEKILSSSSMYMTDYSCTNDEEDYKEHLITITQYITGIYTFYKNEDWESEKEYRMYYLYDKKNHIENTSKIIEITNSGSFLKKNPAPTKHVFVNQFDKSSVKEITIGPKLDFTKTKNEIEKWLNKHGYNIQNVKITESKKKYK